MAAMSPTSTVNSAVRPAAQVVSSLLEDAEPFDAKSFVMRSQPRITVSFSRWWWWENDEEDPIEEHGWIDEDGEPMVPDKFDREDGLTVVDLAVSYLRRNGADEASSTDFHPGVWYSTYAEMDTDGVNEERHYHLKGFTPEQEREVYVQWRKDR